MKVLLTEQQHHIMTHSNELPKECKEECRCKGKATMSRAMSYVWA